MGIMVHSLYIMGNAGFISSTVGPLGTALEVKTVKRQDRKAQDLEVPGEPCP